MIRLFTLCAAAVLLVSGCQQTPHPKTVKPTPNNAWDSFASADYEESLKYFQYLIETEGSPAIVGAGWCSVRLGNLSDAETYFASASAADPDRWAGWTFVRWGLGDPQDAISKANSALQLQSNYVFSRDNRIDFHDLIWIQAASYFQLNDRSNCLSKIQVLDDHFVANLNAANIDQILLAKLQELGSSHE